MKIQAPKGTKDVLPGESASWQTLESIIRRQASLFGFDELRFPAFEHTELFLRGVGETTDVVQKEMYTFTDKGGRSITLRPEGTASVVRSIVEHGLYAGALPLKLYYIAPNFRYEKPQAGRLRQHHQFGAECFGSALPQVDVEIISLAEGLFSCLGIQGVSLEINTIGCPECRPAYQEALKSYFSSRVDMLCPTCAERLERNPLRILDCKSSTCQDVVKNAPNVLDTLCGECEEHFESVKDGLNLLGIEFSVSSRLVRGLDYYTRTVFEFLAPIDGVPRALCAGGRYDGLVQSLGGPSLPAVGFGCGLERLLLFLPSRKAESEGLYIASMDEVSAKEAALTCRALRGLDVPCVYDISGRGLKAQMKYADKLGVKWCIVLGHDEIASRTATLKNMRTGESQECSLDSPDKIAESIKRHGA